MFTDSLVDRAKVKIVMQKKDSLLKPYKLSFKKIDFLKSLFCIIRAFKKTFTVEPGLYFLGEEYDKSTPLLVTCNYHLTVYLLWSYLKSIPLRILVIDTDGINVWCSSAEGKFCAEEIINQLLKYEKNILTDKEKIEMVLPKLSLSGVSIKKLKANNIIPLIGPIYASKIPSYLSKRPLEDCTEDKFEFSFKDRLFTMPASMIQFTKYMVFAAILLFIWDYFTNTKIYWQTIPIGLIFSFLYIVLFPFLPTKTFSVKGLFLFGAISFVYFLHTFVFMGSKINIYEILFYFFFTAGTSVFFSLYYTGNSGVSNYSLVKKEIKNFLPLSFIFYLISSIIVIIKGLQL
ncbi:MAG: hypothetical protein D6734_07745 [Candidatus Schekmanbacteria bacterium]|nr:MAG: hypothetical protein D6734_07745 [Candidatus Schekmanbacteria bacterium]